MTQSRAHRILLVFDSGRLRLALNAKKRLYQLEKTNNPRKMHHKISLNLLKTKALIQT